jgi:hypothetical protein
MAGGLRVFSGGSVVVLGGGMSSGPILPPVPNPSVKDQSATERALGLPQILNVVVSYQGILKSSMGVAANETDQQPFP